MTKRTPNAEVHRIDSGCPACRKVGRFLTVEIDALRAGDKRLLRRMRGIETSLAVIAREMARQSRGESPKVEVPANTDRADH